MSLDALKEKIRSLETERDRLANEVEIMRKAAENRAVSLEEDIKQMREESKTLRELLFSGEKPGVASSAAKPTLAATVEPIAKTVPEISTQTEVQENISRQVVPPKPMPPPTSEVAPPTLVNAVTQTVPEIVTPESQPEKAEVKNETPSQDDVSKTLSSDEKNVIDILREHGGKYARTSIRAEAGLSWLQSNRIISHLAELGLVSLEKSGASMEVLLKETS